jgi:4-amino-4-deoxy-L-arabinose transferase-like glycosyltransferase
VAALLLTCGVEAAVPHFGGALRYYDWWMHFDLARFYAAPSDLARTYGENATVTSRTPLYNVLGGVALTLLGNRFSAFQVMTAAVGWLYILPFALLARRLTGVRAALPVAVAALSPLILQSHTYTWPKGLATFCVLLAVERFIALRAEPQAARPVIAVQLGLASGLTVMAHAGFAGYLVPVYAWLAWDCVHRRLPLRWLLASTASAVLVVLPWYGWAIAQYGLHNAVLAYPGSPYPSFLAWLLDHILIIVTAVVPVAMPANLLASRGDLVQQYFLVYMGTAAGIFGFAFSLKVIAMNIFPRTRLRGPADILTIALTGALIVTLLFEKAGWGWTGAGALFIPALLLLLLATMTSSRLSIRHAWVGLAEVVGFQLVILLWMWSPTSASDLNAQLVVQEHIRFLGRDSWPIGVLLLAAGIAAAVAALRPWLGLSGRDAIPTQSAAA